MGDISRGLAFNIILIVFVGTVIGSLLPELGNLLAHFWGQDPHKYNIYFLIIGIVGIGLALYFGYKYRT